MVTLRSFFFHFELKFYYLNLHQPNQPKLIYHLSGKKYPFLDHLEHFFYQEDMYQTHNNSYQILNING